MLWSRFFQFGVTRNSQVKNLWRLPFINTIWAIWHFRCKAIFDDFHPTLRGSMILILDLIKKAKYFSMGVMQGLDDLTICHRLGVPYVARPIKSMTMVRWIPPPPGVYKINVDGSTNNGKIYAGCIIRNSMGFFVAGFSLSLGRGIALDAKILAGMHGVIFAHSRGWTDLWLESDNALSIKVLQCDGKMIPWRIRSYWDRYVNARRNTSLPATHIFREGNSIADCLARLHSDHVRIGDCPNFISSKLYSDMYSDYFRIT